MQLKNFIRLQTLLSVYVPRHPELVDASKLFCTIIGQFEPHSNYELARQYLGFISRYRRVLNNIPLSSAEWDLLDEVLIDLELEIALSLAEANASRTHNPD